jgi:hypothetical protein
MPITQADKNLNRLPAESNMKKMNGVAQSAYKHCDATAMRGLPVAVQAVGEKLEEEKVFLFMKRTGGAL